MSAVRVRLEAPARRKQAFSLTPLADVMFQLLIFFMLSTSLAPYALIPLGGGGAAEAASEPAPRVAGTPPAEIWQLGHGLVRTGGQAVAFDALPQLATAARLEGVPEIVLLASRDATVQDIATALEILRTARVAKVRLIGRGG